MKIIRNNRNYNDLKVINITSNSTLSFEKIGDENERIQSSLRTSGFFDIIKNKLLFLFCERNKIFVGFDQTYYLLKITNIFYTIKNQDRHLMIEFPTGNQMELDYHFRDLIEDPILLLGSYEENEDYDFGCWLYNIKNSRERQAIVLENNGS